MNVFHFPADQLGFWEHQSVLEQEPNQGTMDSASRFKVMVSALNYGSKLHCLADRFPGNRKAERIMRTLKINAA